LGRIKKERTPSSEAKADHEVYSFCCAGLSRIDASILGRMKTSWEMALGLSSTLNLCVVVNVPYHTFKLWGKFTASHFRQSDGQTMDRNKSPLSQGLVSLVSSRSTHCSANLTWCSDRHSVEADS
jgi:hypothetical protein